MSTAEEEDDAEESAATKFDKLIMPDYVFCLEATEEFLRNRVMNLPESVVHGTHNDEEGLMKRLELYRSLNNDEETVLNYFDEKEFHPEKIDVTKDDSPMMRDTVERIKKTIGEPRNYGNFPFILLQYYSLIESPLIYQYYCIYIYSFKFQVLPLRSLRR